MMTGCQAAEGHRLHGPQAQVMQQQCSTSVQLADAHLNRAAIAAGPMTAEKKAIFECLM
jgi:hypothetical protein